jgi:hypothetical protein
MSDIYTKKQKRILKRIAYDRNIKRIRQELVGATRRCAGCGAIFAVLTQKAAFEEKCDICRIVVDTRSLRL